MRALNRLPLPPSSVLLSRGINKTPPSSAHTSALSATPSSALHSTRTSPFSRNSSALSTARSSSTAISKITSSAHTTAVRSSALSKTSTLALSTKSSSSLSSAPSSALSTTSSSALSTTSSSALSTTSSSALSTTSSSALSTTSSSAALLLSSSPLLPQHRQVSQHRPAEETEPPPAPLSPPPLGPTELGASDINSECPAQYGSPYFEAYNLMEENADVIFDPGDMLSERVYDGGELSRGPHHDSAHPRPASQLPGPRSWPIVGCLPYMLRHKAFDPQRVYLFWEAVRQEFGPIFRKDMPGHPHLVFITQPEDLETLMRSTMYNPLRPGMASLKKIRSRGGADGKTHLHDHIFKGRAGILAEQEGEWWRVRRVVQRPLSNASIVSRYLPQMDQVAKQFVDRIRMIRDESGEVPETFNTELYKWALESLGTIALDRRLGLLEPNLPASSQALRLIHLAKQLLKALHDTENVKLWQYFPTESIRKLQEAHQVFTDVALEAISDTERLLASRPKKRTTHTSPSTCPFHHHDGGGGGGGDEGGDRGGSGGGGVGGGANEEGPVEGDIPSLLETLLGTPNLSREDVLTFILDMIATGIDTSSHAVGNLLYLLARHPRVQQKVQEEVQTVLGRGSNCTITQEHLSSLPYLKAVFRESLRVMPVNVGIVRRLTRDTVLGGYLVPRGWEVVAPTMLMNHEESIFPRAKEFLPERFLRGSPYSPHHHFAFLPFSYGPRMCIGRRIAYQEIFCLTVRILNEFNLEYRSPEEVHLINRLSYGPSRPLTLTFTDRTS